MITEKKVTINREAKEYILNYLQEWIDQLSRYDFSFRKGIVRAIYNKIEAIPVEEKISFKPTTPRIVRASEQVVEKMPRLTLKSLLKYDGAGDVINLLRKIVMEKQGSIAIIGGMGAGKTTLAKAIMSEFPNDSYYRYDEIATDRDALNILNDISKQRSVIFTHYAQSVENLHIALYHTAEAKEGLKINREYKVDYVVYCERNSKGERVYAVYQTEIDENRGFVGIPLAAFIEKEKRYTVF